MSEAAHANKLLLKQQPSFKNITNVCTWVIERYQHVRRGLLLGSPLKVNNVKGNPLCFSYVITHTACGVDDKTEHRRLGDAHQSAGI